MYKKAKILIFCMIFVAGSAFSQISTHNSPSDKDLFNTKLSVGYRSGVYKNGVIQNFKKKQEQYSTTLNKSNIKIGPYSCTSISADFYTRNFGFFCKKELQFEKLTKIPLKFRLGSLQYNDYLEGKPNNSFLPNL